VIINVRAAITPWIISVKVSIRWFLIDLNNNGKQQPSTPVC
jgi:hypothetical protein